MVLLAGFAPGIFGMAENLQPYQTRCDNDGPEKQNADQGYESQPWDGS
jgi:hypothetical protein